MLPPFFLWPTAFQKVLEDANIRLKTVASDVLGVSGLEMIRALIRGEDPTQMADLARRRLRSKIPQLREALQSHVSGGVYASL